MAAPLESTKYFILLALAAEPMHGTAIRRHIVGDTLGYNLRDSTLYSALKSLLVAGLIEEALGSDAYRYVYQLSAKGYHALETEVRVHRRAVALAEQRLHL